jgi:hypothetical protein
MKRFLWVGILLAGAAGLLPGQSCTVVIQNTDEATFHYVLDPPELTAFDPASSIFPNVVYDYFAEEPLDADEFSGFSELDPGQTVRLEGLSEGKHLLVGFFEVPGERGFSVRVITLQAGGGLDERTYRIYTQPALITARAGRGRIEDYPPVPAKAIAEAEEAGEAGAPPAGAAEAATRGAAAPGAAAPGEGPAAGAPSAEKEFFRFQIDNRYEDWEAIPTFLSFPDGRDLSSFTREQYGGPFEVLPIGRSRHWGSGGSSINEVKVAANRRAVYLYISTHSALSANLSIFLYFHNERNLRRPGATNHFTLELVPSRAEKPGLAVLWEKDRKPVIAGSLASGSFFLEARIEMEQLYDLLRARPEITFFDLTTTIYDRQELAYEEFYIASVPLAEIPTEETLY